MKKNKQIGFIFLLQLLLCSNYSFACNCIGNSNIKQALKSSDFVFRGKVIEKTNFIIDTLFADRYVYNVQYTFEIETIYKGRKKNRKQIISVVTGVGNGDCGFEFEKGQEYIVYTDWKDKYYSAGQRVTKFLYTDICKRTTSQVKKEETEIKKYRKPCKWFSP